MSDVATRFHENWLGLVQPIDGLVVSIPALVAAECMQQLAPAVQKRLIELCPAREGERPVTADLWAFLDGMLQLGRGAFDVGGDAGDAGELPEDLMLYVPEGGQTLRPTAALRRLEVAQGEPGSMDDSTPASRAGAKYEMLLWRVPEGLALDKPETQTGPWEYPPSAKFDRLLRECRVPIGVLTNGSHVRLCYAPHGESSGAMTFRLEDMVQVGGRPILDAFVMLLSDHRWFGAEPARRLPAILKDSRARQADITNTLADQMFEALTILLAGFEAAAERDGDELLREALLQEDDQVYNGLLTMLLRLVFVLYAEDRGLMPVEHEVYGKHLSALALFDGLQADHGAFPDTMGRRFGAYPRLVALFRAVFFGVRAGELYMPPRSGVLFDPERYPFLEGWQGGGAPVGVQERAALRVPSVSDETIHRVLEKLLMLGGQRLSYRALEVEQIGSVYEALMGFHVQRVVSPSVCLRGAKVWVGTREVLDVEPGRRAAWLDDLGLAKANARKIAEALAPAKTEAAVLEVLQGFAVARIPTAQPGMLVIQPGEERRRTSSHYTPRSLSEPIVRRTLEPLIMAMGGAPGSEKLLRLKVCDPAMGSGAFLVAACRFLADQVVAAWTREGVLSQIVAGHEDPVMHARRLVAQKCLYGVDKNPFAVNLAKLSLWLETLAKNEPFTFVDHALKCGDSLVGLSIEQIKRFEWTPDVAAGAGSEKKVAKKVGGRQLGLFDGVIENALLHAYTARKKLLELAETVGDHVAIGSEKVRLHEEAELALERARVIADVLIGAFFAKDKDKARVQEAGVRRDVVQAWLMQGSGGAVPVPVQQWVAAVRESQRPFHWGLEFPEVFWEDREDPLEGDAVNRGAWVDAVIGNPPFFGGSTSAAFGDDYFAWLKAMYPPAAGKTDICAFFFRRADYLLGTHGTLGLVATNTIAQGDTRESGLLPVVLTGARIYEAWPSRPWPGEAAVSVAVVHVARGRAVPAGAARLNGLPVAQIDSRLQAGSERPSPVRLAANHLQSFIGCKIYGQGFLISRSEREALIAEDSRNAERIQLYVGGEDVNTSPTLDADRWVINFGTMTLHEAKRWPALLAIAETVRLERSGTRDTADGRRLKELWWQFFRTAPDLYAAIKPLQRCLITSAISKHRVFAMVDTNAVYSHNTYVFSLPAMSSFAVLQSRPHVFWANLLSSGLEDRSGYRPSDCFETFPFPHDPTPLEPIGERLYTTRAAYMLATDQGLTKTYNALKSPACDDPRILALRELHLELDRAVLTAYGWSDIPIPLFQDPTTPAEKSARQAFEDEILDRLFALNAERAAEERRLGVTRTSLAGQHQDDGR